MGYTNVEAARIFLRIAEMMSYREESSFKVRAYYRAALTLSNPNLSLAQLAAEGKLETLPGVGEAIAGKIGEILETGTCALYERLKAEVPGSIQRLLCVPGLTPRLVRFLETEFQARTVEEFMAMAASGGLGENEGLALKPEDAAQMLRAAEALGVWEEAEADPFADEEAA